ncbi:hypothetical protein [Methylomonas methanica]|uniref:hypothetical protein n=1 Tax=Methylomonas methanica TaxID=421 RepID=UPI0026B521BD
MYTQPGAPDPVNRRLILLGLIAACLMLLWKMWPLVESLLAPNQAPVRTVVARGDFAADEKNTIEQFERSKDSVVYITTSALVRDVWTRTCFLRRRVPDPDSYGMRQGMSLPIFM